ncbi:P-loop containing nucleoside triphosphate hydrolase protein [Penicillium herquei]|nr:P-loop containing nucleoside triphosphate hydrolase protein [Penicillium herquei]
MASISFGDRNRGNQIGISNGPIHLPPVRPETPPSPQSTIPFRRDPDFVDRGTLLDRIHEKGTEPGARFALVGLGGVGKSQLAIEYCYRIRDQSPDTWILWIHASNAARFEQSCRDIANRAKINGPKNSKGNVFEALHDWLNDTPTRKWVLVIDSLDDDEFLHSTSSAQTDDSPGRSIWSFFRPSLKGSILITSRSRGVASKIAEENDIISIEPMEGNHAITLFEKKLEAKAEREDMLKLTAALEFMPLAIVQAALYIKRMIPRYSVKQYLDDFSKSDRKKVALLKHQGGSLRRDEEAQNAILLTLQMTFDQLLQTRPSAADLLSLMSFFDRKGIPDDLIREHAEKPEDNWSVDGRYNEESLDGLDDRSQADMDEESMYRSDDERVNEPDEEFFDHSSGISSEDKQRDLQEFLDSQTGVQDHQWNFNLQEDRDFTGDFTEHDSDVLNQAEDFESDILTLKEYSLISIGVIETHFEMHRLVQLGVQEWLKVHTQVEKWKGCFISLLYRNFPLSEAKNWARCESLFLHVQSAILYQPSDEEMVSEWASLLFKGASHAMYKRSFTDAAKLAELATYWTERVYAKQSHFPIRSIVLLGDIYSARCEWRKAEELQVKMIETLSRVLEPEHYDTLTVMGCLASTYHAQGRWKEAAELKERILEAHKRILGPENPETLDSIRNLALTYRSLRRWKESEELCIQVIEAHKRLVKPENHSSILHGIMSDLAWTYWNQGKLKEAEELYIQTIEASKRVLWSEHPDTLSFTVGLARTYRSQERWREAEELHSQIMNIRKQVLGSEHPDTLTSMDDLATTYKSQRRWQEAEELYSQTMNIEKRVLGPEHPNTLIGMNNLGATYWSQGRWREAEEIHSRTMDIRKRVLGQEHPDTLSSMGWLGATYKSQKRWQEAEELHSQTLNIRKRVLGSEHPATLATNLPVVLQLQWTN